MGIRRIGPVGNAPDPGPPTRIHWAGVIGSVIAVVVGIAACSGLEHLFGWN